MRDEAETKIVDAFYRGINDDIMLDEAMSLLARHFDSPSACLGEIDAVDGRWMIGCGTLDSSQLRLYARAAAVDPAPRAFSALRLCTASTTDRVWSDRERARSIFFNEYLRPAGLDHSMGSPLFLDARRFALLGVHQAPSRRRFDDDDIACLERLSPHVARTLHLRRTFLDLRRKEKTFEAIVEGRSTGMVGRAGRSTLFVNHAAQAIARTSDGLTLDRLGRLVVNDARASKRMATLEADVLAGGPGGVVRRNATAALHDFRRRLDEKSCCLRIGDFRRSLELRTQLLQTWREKLSVLLCCEQEKLRARLGQAENLLRVLGPHATLKRGYSITLDENGRLLLGIRDVHAGQRIVTRLADGEIHSTVAE